MKVVLFRAWSPSPVTATFSDLPSRGVGGTEFQQLMHARALHRLGHEVVVVGVTSDRRVEEGIVFEGSPNSNVTRNVLLEHHADAGLVLLISGGDLAPLRSALPDAMLTEVCQNGPSLRDKHIDMFAFVGEGQLARYSSRYRRIRHRFVLVPNVVPWESVYSHVHGSTPEPQVLWIGGFTKPGLRRWGIAMERVLREYTSIRWVLCGPSYGAASEGRLPGSLTGIDLPRDRVLVKSLPLHDLAREISRSLIVTASLGGEDGPVSYLDGHALGVPVVTGNDVVGAYANPLGTGFRASTAKECETAVRLLLDRPDLRRRMGTNGQRFILENYTESRQAEALRRLAELASFHSDPAVREAMRTVSRSDARYPASHWIERASLKLTRTRKIQRHGRG